MGCFCGRRQHRQVRRIDPYLRSIGDPASEFEAGPPSGEGWDHGIPFTVEFGMLSTQSRQRDDMSRIRIAAATGAHLVVEVAVPVA